MCLIGPGKKAVAECTDKLFDAIQVSTIVCCSPENEDATLVRPVAIGRFVDHIPFQCIPYVNEIRVESTHSLDGSIIHYLQMSQTRTHHQRIQLPIRARPLVLTTIHRHAGAPAFAVMNSFTHGCDEIIGIVQTQTARLNQNWQQRATTPTTTEGYLDTLPGSDEYRQRILDEVNAVEETADAQVTIIDNKPTFIILRYRARVNDIREQIKKIRKKLRGRTGYGPIPFTYAIISPGVMTCHTGSLEILAEVVAEAKNYDIEICTKPEEGSLHVGNDSEGNFTVGPLGLTANDHQYQIIRNCGGQISSDEELAVKHSNKKSANFSSLTKGKSESNMTAAKCSLCASGPTNLYKSSFQPISNTETTQFAEASPQRRGALEAGEAASVHKLQRMLYKHYRKRKST